MLSWSIKKPKPLIIFVILYHFASIVFFQRIISAISTASSFTSPAFVISNQPGRNACAKALFLSFNILTFTDSPHPNDIHPLAAVDCRGTRGFGHKCRRNCYAQMQGRKSGKVILEISNLKSVFWSANLNKLSLDGRKFCHMSSFYTSSI